MWFIRLLLFPLFLIAQEFEVSLPTQNPLKPLYLTTLHVPHSEYDWRYFDELREVLVFDLNTNGFSTVLIPSEECENQWKWPDVRNDFSVPFWQTRHIPYVLAVQVLQNRLQLTAFDVDKGALKTYPEIPLVGRLEEDRRQIHRLVDGVQKDLFGVEGIASLKILYAQRHKSGEEWKSEIWICDADGAGAHRVLSEKGYCVSPSFFPIAALKDVFYYVSFQQGQSKIFSASLKEAVGRPLVLLRGSQALPAFNQRGTQMAFISDVAGRPDLFVQNFDGKGKTVGKARQLFSAPRATQASPTFSPDGKKVAFVSDKEGPPRIYVLDITGAKETQKPHPRLLTKRNRENTSPAWSPNGKLLSFSAKVDGIRQIWIYDFETEEEFALTSGPANKENPSWAPDSLHLVYNTENEESAELYLIDLHRREPVLISKGPEQKRFASWEQRGSAP